MWPNFITFGSFFRWTPRPKSEDLWSVWFSLSDLLGGGGKTISGSAAAAAPKVGVALFDTGIRLCCNNFVYKT
jgi:hypothetical protein